MFRFFATRCASRGLAFPVNSIRLSKAIVSLSRHQAGAGEEGFEPSNAGIKIRCLRPAWRLPFGVFTARAEDDAGAPARRIPTSRPAARRARAAPRPCFRMARTPSFGFGNDLERVVCARYPQVQEHLVCRLLLEKKNALQ